jgi:hypothetical protein
VFAGAVNIIVAAGLGAVLADTAGTDGAATALIGAASALLYAALVFLPAHRAYRRVAEQPATEQPVTEQAPERPATERPGTDQPE